MKIYKAILCLVGKFRKYFQRHRVSKYEKFLQLMDLYCSSVNCPTQIEKTLEKLSYDGSKQSPWSFVSKHSNLNAISMDDIAKNVVRKLYYPKTTKDDESPASVDAFLIDSNGFWYFVEFKNQRLDSDSSARKMHQKCIEKSYANVYWLLKILEDLKKKELFSFKSFEPQSKDIEPLDFVKKYCKYILVLGRDTDTNILGKIKNAKLANMPSSEAMPFLKKLSSYIFNSADVYGYEQFDDDFVKNFKYS